MNSETDSPIVLFLKETMRLHRRLPSQLAADIGLSHATVSRWLHGHDVPSTRSCRKLAELTGVPLQKILSLSGHFPAITESPSDTWPEFGEYARKKYSAELDEDLITAIENLIAQRRKRLNLEKESP